MVSISIRRLHSTILALCDRLTFVVVLLDEADVYMEQRSVNMLQRNAVVSGQFLNTSSFYMIAHFSQSFYVRWSISTVSLAPVILTPVRH